MKIAYIAKHESGGNDEEGAITNSLTELGHDVNRLREYKGAFAYRLRADVALFHKWSQPDYLAALAQRMPCFFWYFDLVDHPDPLLANRCALRRQWMADVLPLVRAGFCTDGDWVANHRDKLYWLPQGAITHTASRVVQAEGNKVYPILFTGIAKGGRERLSFVQEMEQQYKRSFYHTSHGLHGPDLALAISRAKIVVAPDSPVTDRYWSNRVYVMLGYGAFLLHPYCAKLAEQYKDGEELVFYRSRQDLHHKIAYYLERPGERAAIAEQGWQRTMKDHTFTNRCQQLMETVRQVCQS